MEGERQVFLGEDGRDLPNDAKGFPQGKPALESVVCCGRCGNVSRGHPYQKILDEASAKRQSESPVKPSFMKSDYSEINGMDAVQRRLDELEKTVATVVREFQKEITLLRESFTVTRKVKA